MGHFLHLVPCLSCAGHLSPYLCLALHHTRRQAYLPKPLLLHGLTAWRARVQIANSWGQSVDKGSYAERTAFVRDHLDLVLDSAERPFDGHK